MSTKTKQKDLDINPMQAELILDAAVAWFAQEARQAELEYIRHTHPEFKNLKVADTGGPQVDRKLRAAQYKKEAIRCIVLGHKAAKLREELHGQNLSDLMSHVRREAAKRHVDGTMD